eukprot:2398458-Rhodomonas_salina.1
MVAAQCPGVQLVLVCTHAASAKRASESVEGLASAVEQAVRAELVRLNAELVQQVKRLEELKADVEQRRNTPKLQARLIATEQEGQAVGERLRAV